MLKTPYFLIDEAKIQANCQILRDVMDKTGAKILLAQKAYSIYQTYPLIGKYLSGTTASGFYEAKLGHEEMGGETHVFSPGYDEDTFDELLTYVDHISFNSFSQWEKYKERALSRHISCGLRVNPAFSTQDGHEIYDPCASGSRLGILKNEFVGKNLEGIEGLHFHTLCEQNAEPLKATLEVIERDFGELLHQMKWLNFGGGHHITRQDYNLDLLCECILYFKEKYHLEIYLEPGEAVVLNAGSLECKVVDILHNEIDIAILDTSATCHMPDVIEMPYRPPLLGGGEVDEYQYTYRLGGSSCLAGDIVGDYSFAKPLEVGQQLSFLDMALYTMVKTNTFNGMPLPSIVLKTIKGDIKVLREFGYQDFKMRL